jgi:hypothetical protein
MPIESATHVGERRHADDDRDDDRVTDEMSASVIGMPDTLDSTERV